MVRGKRAWDRESESVCVFFIDSKTKDSLTAQKDKAGQRYTLLQYFIKKESSSRLVYAVYTWLCVFGSFGVEHNSRKQHCDF